jgi:glutamine synthetase
MTYAKMLASIMAATGLAAGVAYTYEELDAAGVKIVEAYHTEVGAPQNELQATYEEVIANMND